MPDKITSTESIIFGFVFGVVLGALNEWQNNLAGNQNWINFPVNTGLLGSVVFGTVSIGLLLGYGVFGATLTFLTFLLAQSVDIEGKPFGFIFGVLAVVGGATLILVNTHAMWGLCAAVVGVALILRARQHGEV